MEEQRKMPWAVYAALFPFALVLWAFVSLLNHKANQSVEATAHGELILTREIAGHSYALFFHRARPHFNSVERDGERVFDSRNVEGADGCVWELLDRSGRPLVRCYRVGADPEILELDLDLDLP
ncbi:MAG: hypothetical protein ACRC2H_11180 [Silanimonas sp.]